MKLCVFTGDQKELLTCYNPVEMILLGAFNGKVNLNNDAGDYLKSKLPKDIPECKPISPSLDLIAFPYSTCYITSREAVFSKYIEAYYKLPNWEQSLDTLLFYRYRYIHLLHSKLNSGGISQELDLAIKQALLELAWNWEYDPKTLLTKPSCYENYNEN